MIKLIAFDLDGTLLNHSGEISERTLSVLNRAHEKGILLMCCTGRTAQSAHTALSKLQLDKKNGYFCGMNGQWILSYRDYDVVQKEMLSESEIRKLAETIKNRFALAVLQKENKMLIVYDKGKKWISDFYLKLSRLLWIYRQNDVYEKPESISLEQLSLEQYAKICFTAMPWTIDKMITQISHHFNEYTCSKVAPFWMECQRKGISKGNALKAVAEKEGILQEEIIAFGDGENDISMLAYAGKGIAMKNAMRKVKNCADEICGSCNHDGVAKYLEDIFELQ
ncbi:MAG: HAD family phosphatase [Erysipelotrichaceae bacterium]|nr:HAD family phosphatase [Erysipelotrichaceae bacterium]